MQPRQRLMGSVALLLLLPSVRAERSDSLDVSAARQNSSRKEAEALASQQERNHARLPLMLSGWVMDALLTEGQRADMSAWLAGKPAPVGILPLRRLLHIARRVGGELPFNGPPVWLLSRLRPTPEPAMLEVAQADQKTHQAVPGHHDDAAARAKHDEELRDRLQFERAVLIFVVAVCSMILEILFFLVVAGIFTNCHWAEMQGQEPEPKVSSPVGGAGADFHYGLFDVNECCDDDCCICLWSFCCPFARWAGTLSRPKLGLGWGYWHLVILWGFLDIGINPVSGPVTFLVSSLLLAWLQVTFRHKLREAYGLEHHTCSTCLMDVLIWSFCCWCAAAQEARQVKYVGLPVAVVPPNAS